MFTVRCLNVLPSGFKRLFHEFLHSLGRFGGVILETCAVIVFAMGGKVLFDQWIDHTNCCGCSLLNRLAKVTNFKDMLDFEARCRVGGMIKLLMDLNLFPTSDAPCPRCSFHTPVEKPGLTELVWRLLLAYRISRMPVLFYSFKHLEKYMSDVVFAIDLIESCIVITIGTCKLHATADSFMCMVPALYEELEKLKVGARILWQDYIETKHNHSGPEYKREGNGSNGKGGCRCGGELRGAGAIIEGSAGEWIDEAGDLSQAKATGQARHDIVDIVLDRKMQENYARVQHIAGGGYISNSVFIKKLKDAEILRKQLAEENEGEGEEEENLLEEAMELLALIGDDSDQDSDSENSDGEDAVEQTGGEVGDEFANFEQVHIDKSLQIMANAGNMLKSIGKRKETTSFVQIKKIEINSTEIPGGGRTLPLPMPPNFSSVVEEDPFFAKLTRRTFRDRNILLVFMSTFGQSDCRCGMEISSSTLNQFFLDDATQTLYLNLKCPAGLIGKNNKKSTVDPFIGLLRSAIEIKLTFSIDSFALVIEYFTLLEGVAPAYKVLRKTTATDYTATRTTALAQSVVTPPPAPAAAADDNADDQETKEDQGEFDTRTCHSIDELRALREVGVGQGCRSTMLFRRFKLRSEGQEWFVAPLGLTEAPGKQPPLVVVHKFQTKGYFGFGRLNASNEVELIDGFDGCVDARKFPFLVGVDLPESEASKALFLKLKVHPDHQKVDGSGGAADQTVVARVTRQATGAATAAAAAAAAGVATGTVATNVTVRAKPTCGKCAKNSLSSIGILNTRCKKHQIEELRLLYVNIKTFRNEYPAAKNNAVLSAIFAKAEKVLELQQNVQPIHVRKCYAQCVEQVRFVWWAISLEKERNAMDVDVDDE